MKIQKEALDDCKEVKEAIIVFVKDQKGFFAKSQIENVVKIIGELLSVAEILQILDSVQYDMINS